ncbi:MAG: carbohydrate kinase [Gammaproteobacteria bacterium]|nr:carbohydrate kinase [Gammaproteobacteria bacterium]
MPTGVCDRLGLFSVRRRIMSKVLVVGNLTLDIIHGVDHYPVEDEELRAHSQRYQRGGNAANTAVVLAQHGHRVSFVGTRADDSHAQGLAAELAAADIDLQYCQVIRAAACPLSCILHNEKTGSRTIVHYRDLAEYDAAGFAGIPLAEYDGFHFEGRNLPQLVTMLEQVQRARVDQPILLEVEKPRPGIEAAFAYADVLLFSRVYAMAEGCRAAGELFDRVQARHPQGILICTWGEQGAYARTPDGADLHAPALPVREICDSVGAGDTFNAGVIHGLLSGKHLHDTLLYANALAAKKLQQPGFAGLAGG